jgi:hypothetical protein
MSSEASRKRRAPREVPGSTPKKPSFSKKRYRVSAPASIGP